MNPQSPPPIRVISSMATRPLMTQLVDDFSGQSGTAVELVAVGGVDAARRVQAGESFDLVILAADAIDALIGAGHLRADSRRALVESAVAVAVPALTPGAARPDISTEESLKQTLLQARRIGYSTGPSGTALLRLLKHWGLHDTLSARLVQAQAGVPVGRLLAEGAVDIGFQQLIELQGIDGICVLGCMPRGLEIITTFVAALTAAAEPRPATLALLDFMASPAHAALMRRLGLERAPG